MESKKFTEAPNNICLFSKTLSPSSCNKYVDPLRFNSESWP